MRNVRTDFGQSPLRVTIDPLLANNSNAERDRYYKRENFSLLRTAYSIECSLILGYYIVTKSKKDKFVLKIETVFSFLNVRPFTIVEVLEKRVERKIDVIQSCGKLVQIFQLDSGHRTHTSRPTSQSLHYISDNETGVSYHGSLYSNWRRNTAARLCGIGIYRGIMNAAL